ncbi:MAG: hypothetical protein H8E37_04950, partial [Planctomycetes bacterium]|nr:hypothetical protein [Planctomycetota bacterium]
MRRTQMLLVLVATLATNIADTTTTSAADAWVASPFNAKPGDWPHWRGPEMNGISREKGLPESWDPDSGENVIWENKDLASRSTPIIMNGKLYLM